ncbi:HAD family hydrolase [Bacillus suaedaesalsae]|uniref:HAD family hydrolase n=1 Tax=Bacillus suaedaesalsae TaxID=2810349 RepID=A0ABS2DFK4_9BACI|nr:HAD family hydrolase [Bacillus suaedaesalsae]MBM6617257.1 HAD family hydrolase [Bacillus suaedaesalsae]
MRWEAICFDIDNTLFDYEVAFQKGMIASCENLMSGINSIEWFKLFKKYCDEFWGFYEKKEWTQQEYRFKRLYHSLMPFNIFISQEFSEHFHYEFEHTVHLYAKPYPDVLQTLSALKELGFTLGIISNGKKDTQILKLKSLGVLSLFGGNIFISEEIQYEKPNQQIFHYAREELGCVQKPIYVGDSFKQDVVGAMEANWDVIYFQIEKRKKIRENIPVCSTFQEIYEFVTK